MCRSCPSGKRDDVRLRHRVVAHGAGHELTVVVVVRAFVERLGKTLRESRSMSLNPLIG